MSFSWKFSVLPGQIVDWHIEKKESLGEGQVVSQSGAQKANDSCVVRRLFPQGIMELIRIADHKILKLPPSFKMSDMMYLSFRKRASLETKTFNNNNNTVFRRGNVIVLQQMLALSESEQTNNYSCCHVPLEIAVIHEVFDDGLVLTPNLKFPQDDRFFIFITENFLKHAVDLGPFDPSHMALYENELLNQKQFVQRVLSVEVGSSVQFPQSPLISRIMEIEWSDRDPLGSRVVYLGDERRKCFLIEIVHSIVHLLQQDSSPISPAFSPPPPSSSSSFLSQNHHISSSSSSSSSSVFPSSLPFGSPSNSRLQVGQTFFHASKTFKIVKNENGMIVAQSMETESLSNSISSSSSSSSCLPPSAPSLSSSTIVSFYSRMVSRLLIDPNSLIVQNSLESVSRLSSVSSPSTPSRKRPFDCPMVSDHEDELQPPPKRPCPYD